MTTVYENFRALLDESISDILIDPYKYTDRVYQKLYNKKDSKSRIHTERLLGSGGLFEEVQENSAVPSDDLRDLGMATYTNKGYGKRVNVGWFTIDDAKERSKALADALQMVKGYQKLHELTKDTLAAEPFNLGDDATYTGGYNSEPLFSSSHTIKEGGTYNNNLLSPGGLTATNLIAALEHMDKATNDRGHDIELEPKYLVVPPELENDAIRITETDKVVDSNNNDINVIRRYNVQVLKWKKIDDPGEWFIVGEDMFKSGMTHLLRMPLKKYVVNDPGNIRVSAIMLARWCFGWTDWRSVLKVPAA